jgi:DNA topoisomerase I
MASAKAVPRKKRPSPPGGLRYSRDGEKGYRRETGTRSFQYRDAQGERVTDADTLERIRLLVIPPAWTDAWICGDERGHLQATGRDARGRKQYRYHPRWREMRDADKFDHLMEFAKALPRIRRQARADIALPGLPRRKVLALLVQLLERTSIRIGNERYAEENDSFGLTTMRNRHVKVSGARVEFQFRGKSGKFHRIAVDDPKLARIVRRCRDLPGQELFQYQDEAGEVQSIGSSDVNDYLKEIAGCEISTKDFRTWAGSVHVSSMLRRCEQVGVTHVAAAVRIATAGQHAGHLSQELRASARPRSRDLARSTRASREAASAWPAHRRSRVPVDHPAAQSGEQNCAPSSAQPNPSIAWRIAGSFMKRWLESFCAARML